MANAIPQQPPPVQVKEMQADAKAGAAAATHVYHTPPQSTRMHLVATKMLNPAEGFAEQEWYNLPENRVLTVTVQPQKPAKKTVSGWEMDVSAKSKVEGTEVPTKKPTHVVTKPTVSKEVDAWMQDIDKDIAVAIKANDFGQLRSCHEELQGMQTWLLEMGDNTSRSYQVVHYLLGRVQKKLDGIVAEQTAAVEKQSNEFGKLMQNVTTVDQLSKIQSNYIQLEIRIQKYKELIFSHYRSMHDRSNIQISIDRFHGILVGRVLEIAIASNDPALLKQGMRDAYKLHAELEARKQALTDEYDELQKMKRELRDNGVTTKMLKDFSSEMKKIDAAYLTIMEMQKELHAILDPLLLQAKQKLDSLPAAKASTTKVERMTTVRDAVQATGDAALGIAANG